MILKLSVLQGQPAGKTLAFAVGNYYLGRGPECHVRFNHEWVSRQHCQLRVTADGGILRDLGSHNGTLLNGRLTSGEEKLHSGDQIQIGPVLFSVTLEAETLAILPAADPPPADGEPSMEATADLPALPPETKPKDGR